MTKRTRPVTVKQLTEYVLGRPLTRKEAASLPDRRLSDKEAAGLRVTRIRQAEKDRQQPVRATVGLNRPHLNLAGRKEFNFRTAYRDFQVPQPVDQTAGYFRRCMKRFERWAIRADRLGLDRAKPPAHIMDKAMSLVRMAGEQGKA